MKYIVYRFLVGLGSIVIGMYVSHAMADDIQTVVIGEVKPASSSVADKTTTIGGTTYGFKKNKDAVGNFANFTIDTSTDGGQTWAGNPTVILSASDLDGQGPDPSDDYTLSQLRAIKWVQCPSSDNWSIWAKRHGANAQGNRIVKKELLRAVITGPGKTITDPYTDSIIIDRPYGNSSGDLGQIEDGGTVYLASAGTDEGRINIIELTNDCSDIVAVGPLASLEWYHEDQSVDHREAPSIFEVGNDFFLFTSGKTGWRPNQQKYSYASALAGPWSDMINVGDETGYHSQVFGTSKITATDQSGNSSRLFSGTRNAAVWNGSDNRRVWTPLYFNTTTNLATNYYDYVNINYTTGDVTGINYDHGRKLSISSVSLEGYPDSLANLIDGDETSSWDNSNDPSKITIVYDLGFGQLVKAMKARIFDNFDGSSDVTKRIQKVRVEVGDGVGYTTVFDDFLPAITWLQPVDFLDAYGQFVKITLIETHKGNSAGTTSDFGFYETSFWGENSNQKLLIDDDLEGEVAGNPPSIWTVDVAANTDAIVYDDPFDGNLIELSDYSSTGRAKITKTLLSQSGSTITLDLRVKFQYLGTGEYIRLLSGSTLVMDITNSGNVLGLALTDTAWNHTKIADIDTNTWYNLKVAANTDAGTYDVYLDGSIIWGGMPFRSDAEQIDKVIIGTSTSDAFNLSYYDNIQLAGPLSSTIFDDYFENGVSEWTAGAGSWTNPVDNGSKVYRNDDSGTGYTHRGDPTWADYTVSADAKREGQAAAILGRYEGANRYYQLIIYDDNTYRLNKNVNGSWTTLDSGVFVNTSTEYYNLKMSFSGNQVSAYIDDLLVASVTDSSLSAGEVGLRSVNGSSNFDNLLVTP